MCFPLKPIFLLANSFFIIFFPSGRHAFLYKFIVIAFLGIQLWHEKKKKKEEKTPFLSRGLKLSHHYECKFLLISNIYLIVTAISRFLRTYSGSVCLPPHVSNEAGTGTPKPVSFTG